MIYILLLEKKGGWNASILLMCQLHFSETFIVKHTNDILQCSLLVNRSHGGKYNINFQFKADELGLFVS